MVIRVFQFVDADSDNPSFQSYKKYGLKEPRGGLIASVGGPAEKAGLKPDDLIVEFNGETVKDSTHLKNLVAAIGPGKTVSVKVIRDGKEDDQNWAIRYMVVDTRNWLPGKRVLVSPRWIKNVSWTDSEVYMDLSREAVRNSPEFNHDAPVNRDYEDRLYDYYGRRKYWTENVSKGRSKI